MIEGFSFSTRGLSPEEALSAYQTLYETWGDEVCGDRTISVELTAHRFNRLILFNQKLINVGHVRSANQVEADAMSHFAIHFVVSGRLVGSEVSGFTAASSGEVVLQDLRKQSRNCVQDGHLITLSVARDLVEAAAGTANGLHGLVLPSSQTGLLGDYLLSLAQRANALDADALPTITRTFVELLGLAIQRTGTGGRRLEFDRREAVERAIEQRLKDPSLSAASIVSETGVSRATLYRLLADYGGVESFIEGRRLAAIRMTLDRPEDFTPLAGLAGNYGFRSETAMRSRFRSRFGITPAAYRRMVDSPSDSLEMIKRRWASWMIEIR